LQDRETLLEILQNMKKHADTTTIEHKEIKDNVDKRNRANERQKELSQEEAAKAWFGGQGIKAVSTKDFENMKRRIRTWEAFVKSKGGNRPPEGYPGLQCTSEQFSAWAANIKGRRKMKSALKNMVLIYGDNIADAGDTEQERRDLKCLADKLPIDKIKKGIDYLERL